MAATKMCDFQLYSGIPRAMQPAEKHATEGPRPGDVVITKQAGRFFLRVMPHPHRLSFAEFDRAVRIARQWAAATSSGIWQTTGNGTYESVRSGTTAEDRS
jgi:hypothetical protein